MSIVTLTQLYVPADRPDRVAKAFASPADLVILDLEDAVAPSRKDTARAALTGELQAASAAGQLPDGRAQVRVNGTGTPWRADDLTMLASLSASVSVRLPKVESAAEVREVAALLPGRRLVVLLESALGVERALELAASHPQVEAVALGEADLRSDLGVSDDSGLAWARGRVVVAARAAGLQPPAMSVYASTRDLDGLRASCLVGRSLGFLGRAAIHPVQLPVIRDAFLPTLNEVERAREILALVGRARAHGVGAVTLPDGTFLDAAMIEHARAIVSLSRGAATDR